MQKSPRYFVDDREWMQIERLARSIWPLEYHLPTEMSRWAKNGVLDQAFEKWKEEKPEAPESAF